MEKHADWPVGRVAARDVAARRARVESLRSAAPGPGVVENGGKFRMATAPGKRSVCGIADGMNATLCGAPREGADGTPLLNVSGDVWLTVSDPEIVPEGYRPCADCVAAYKPAAQTGRKKVTWVTDVDKSTGAETHRMVLVATAEPVTERLPENVAPDGSTPRDAERESRVWARLGNVVPRLTVEGSPSGGYVVAPESLWSLGGKSVHAGAEINGRLFLVCRDTPESGKHPEGDKVPTLNCSACRSLLYVGGTMVPLMLRVVNRPHDGDRFRPVKGVAAWSADQRTRETDPVLLHAERAQSAQMMRGLGVVDGDKITPGYRKYEFAGREWALKGWVVESLRAPVRDGGKLVAIDGWAYVRKFGKLPPVIWRRMSREEKTAAVRGMSFVRERSRHHREIRAAREAREYKASAMRDYRYAVHNGDETKVRQGPVKNPYPRQGGVFDELRFKRES